MRPKLIHVMFACSVSAWLSASQASCNGAKTQAVSGGATPSRLAAGDVIAPERRTTWSPGLNAVGGIPYRTTIYRTISPSGGDDTATIRAALGGCPSNQVVLLTA
ncbi:MAG TPA: hypothetical protein VMK12_22735, partial [Anaeromyxobacteraceae bacterium]|nr:hypothetical protein [Anaeromyxobacteraceae bacterium]